MPAAPTLPPPSALGARNLSKSALGAKSLSNSGQLPAKPDRTKAAAQDFEAVFLSEMFSHIFDGLDVDPLFGGGEGEKMFRGLLVNEYGKAMARQGGVGLADSVQQAMIKLQEGSHAPASTAKGH
jgi:Rod binding domain-containing protein